MCFTSDYDWYAELVEKHVCSPTTAARCDECGRPIAPGQERLTIYQQQYEECQKCWNDPETLCLDGEHDYGETSNYVCCMKCSTIRYAIRQIEEAEGCRGEETTPSLCGMSEEVSNGNGWPHYVAEAKKLGLHDAAALMIEVYGPFEEVMRDGTSTLPLL